MNSIVGSTVDDSSPKIYMNRVEWDAFQSELARPDSKIHEWATVGTDGELRCFGYIVSRLESIE